MLMKAFVDIFMERCSLSHEIEGRVVNGGMIACMEEQGEHRRNMLHLLRMDCPDGRMKKKHLKKYLSDVFPVGCVDKYAELLFNSLDKQRVGEISTKVFLELITLMASGSVEDRVLASFHLYDTDNDGLVSKEDLYKVVHFRFLKQPSIL